ncbi:hypothetical protein V7O62_10310 [Methanolobus sp. ZRKC2]|uniref:hypothetical protein n=1 Tax=Methanolobus sp. ZRKC2 TaxID=3125783 RepID=UPI00324B9CEE
MEKRKFHPLIAFTLILVAGGAYLGMGYLDQLTNEEPDVNINSSQAVSIVKNDANASAFIEKNFKVPNWRVIKTTFMESPVENSNNSVPYAGNRTWKVEMMERTCACPGTSTLYVVEGYVNVNTGELISVSTMKASERNYEKKTCASTSCH